MTVRWQVLWLAGSTGLSPGFGGVRQVNSQRLAAVAGGDFGAGAEVQSRGSPAYSMSMLRNK
jgi:hypothetical protein